MTGLRRVLGGCAALAGLVGAVWLVAAVFAQNGLAGGPAGSSRSVPLQRDVAAAVLPPVFGAQQTAAAGRDPLVRTMKVEQHWRHASIFWPQDVRADAGGRLAVLRSGGHLTVLDFDRRTARETFVDPRAGEIATLGPYLAVASRGGVRTLLLDPSSTGHALELGGLPVAAHPERLLPDGDDLQVWGRAEHGWSGAELRRTARGIVARRLPELPSGVTPVAAFGRGLVADAGGATLLFAADGTSGEVLPGAPLTVAGDDVVRLDCRPNGCALLVGGTPPPPPAERIGVVPTADSDGLLAPHGVASPDGDRIAASLLLKYHRGWRPAVAHLGSRRIDVLTGVLPRNSPTDAYAWSADGRWLFAPLGGRIGVHSPDGGAHVVDLGGDGVILDMTVLAAATDR